MYVKPAYNPTTIQTCPDPVVLTTDDVNSKHDTDWLAELERRVRLYMTVSLGAVVGGVDDAEGEQDGAVGLAVKERMDKLGRDAQKFLRSP